MARSAAISVACLLGLLIPAAAAPQPALDPSAPAQPATAMTPDSVIRGPAAISLNQIGILHLPAGMALLAQARADALLRKMGNEPNPEVIGMVIDSVKAVVIEYRDDGYLKDGQGDRIDGPALLEAMQKRGRQNLDHQMLKPSQWLEAPHYDQAQHRLTWGLRMETIGANNKVELVSDNYTSAVLTRRGVVSFDLLTEKLTDDGKAFLNDIAAAFAVWPGERYQDIDPKVDKAADYDLLSLIGP